MKLSVASAVAVISVASAHTIFLQLESNGVRNAVSYGIRTPSYDGPITDVSSNYLACNGGPNPTTASDKVIEVKAGSTVRRFLLSERLPTLAHHVSIPGECDMATYAHVGCERCYGSQSPWPNYGILEESGRRHERRGLWKWMVSGMSCRAVGDPIKKITLRFKIQEDGYSNGAWGTSKVISNGGIHAIKIPDCLADGQYLLRAEMIALHGAGSPQGAQLYVRL